MRYIASHEDAYWYWYHAGAEGRQRLRPARVTNLDGVARTGHELGEFDLSSLEAFLDPPPWLESAGERAAGARRHVLVPQGTDGRALRRFVRHRWNGMLPEGALVVVSPGIAVCSPEFSLVQLASALPPAEYVRWACALCASYRIGERGIEEREPITSVARVGVFLEGCYGHRGAGRCRRLLRYVRDGARSPKEVELHLLLALPAGLGGYGLEGDVLNWRLDLGAEDAAIADRPDRRWAEVDLAWPERAVGLEYQGREHEGTVEADRRRLNMLAALGVRVLQMDAAQVSDQALFDRTARQLARLLGREVPEPTDAWRAARGDLRETLLGAGRVRM